MKLDLACGQRKQPGFIGVDLVALPGVDVVHDLEIYPWPFGDEWVDEIYCAHYIEHTADLIKFFNECYRILVPGGKMCVIAPYYTSVRAWQDPTHTRAISENTFLYFNRQQRLNNGLDHYPITADFDCASRLIANVTLAGIPEDQMRSAIEHNWNVIDDIEATLTKRSST